LKAANAPKLDWDKDQLVLTVKFHLSEDDLVRIARLDNSGDGDEESEGLYEMWCGITTGHDNYFGEPDHDAFASFCEEVDRVRKSIPEMMLLALATKEIRSAPPIQKETD